MQRPWTTRTVAVFGILAMGLPARAADPIVSPQPPGVNIGAGWYLRGDIGASINNDPQLSIFPNLVGMPTASLTDQNYQGKYTSSTFPKTRVSPGRIVDLGIGYRFARWLRVDVTGEYRGGAELSAIGIVNDSGTTTGPGGAVHAGNSERAEYRGGMSSAVVLANGYVDLGTYYGITPFVGAGVGAARNHVGKLSVAAVYTSTTSGSAPIVLPFGGSVASGSKTNFAWALMAGLDYSIAPGLKLEFGYRFLDLGRFQTGTETLVFQDGSSLPVPAGGRGRDYIANDIRLGLRWSIDARGNRS